MSSVHVHAPGQGTLTAVVSTGTELTRFLVTGNWNDVENPPLLGNSNTLTLNTISATITFWPRLPNGFTAFVENLDLQSSPETSGNTAVAIAPVQASIVGGVLVSNVIGDTPGVQLLSNSASLNLASQNIPALYYDIQFNNVVFSGVGQALENWAFIASTDSTAICLTSPGLERYAYSGPLQVAGNLA